jgi:two-component system chemotaxis response regulator CheB
MAVELKPDVVILDLAMPSMDGLTAARQISESLPTLPIVMHTLHDLPQLELEAKKNGVRCIVPKSETARIISALDELTYRLAVSPQAAVEKESVTSQPTKVATSEGTRSEVQAAESGSQAGSTDDIARRVEITSKAVRGSVSAQKLLLVLLALGNCQVFRAQRTADK